MNPICILENDLLKGIELTNISAQDKDDGDKLFDAFANSREVVVHAQIARDLISAVDNGFISIGSLALLSKYCHTGGSWTPCIEPARAISKWLTGGMEIPRLVDENDQPVADYEVICKEIVCFVETQA